MARTWPPGLPDIRAQLGRTPDDTANDARLSEALDAAVAFVERIHADRYAFDAFTLLPPVPADMWLGTLRLARRLHSRLQSPDGLIDLGELGSARIPSFDPDIDRALRIGKYRRSVIA